MWTAKTAASISIKKTHSAVSSCVRMEMSKRVQLVVDLSGRIRHLLEDDCAVVRNISEVEKISRNSYVETWDSLSEAARRKLQLRHVVANGKIVGHDLPLAEAWWADMGPVCGPVLGPFSSRDQALTAELEWLRQKGLPVVDSNHQSATNSGQNCPTRIHHEPIDRLAETSADH